MHIYFIQLSTLNFFGLGTDYASEKLFKALNLDVIPVVLGGADYKSITPPNSVINALEFETPKQLAQFLKFVASNETLYNSCVK